jgi:ADP-ribosylglycohydrolase
MSVSADPFAVVERTNAERAFSSVVGGLVAAACADALGWPTETIRSKPALAEKYGVSELQDFVGWRKVVGGRFNAYIDYVAPGEYSDDTQLMLCVARSLCPDGALDHKYFAKSELASWLDYSRGAGRTITAAAKKIRRRVAWNENFFTDGKLDYRASGANGAAMRIAPLALANLAAAAPPLEDAFLNAIITHGHPRAHVGALALVAAVHLAGRAGMEGEEPDARRFVDRVSSEVEDWWRAPHGHAAEQWRRQYDRGDASFERGFLQTLEELRDQLEIATGSDTERVLSDLGCRDPATRGSGTATVVAGIHLFLRHRENVEGAVIDAANAVGTDTDTIGVFAGALTGAYGGYAAVPERWSSQLQDLPYFLTVGELLARIANGDRSAGTLRPRTPAGDTDAVELLQGLRANQLNPGDRVRHEVLGSGWVTAVHAQEVRRRSGGQITYARVIMDIGQHCQFRTHIPESR